MQKKFIERKLISIQPNDFDLGIEHQQLSNNPAAGAIVTFTGNRRVSNLVYIRGSAMNKFVFMQKALYISIFLLFVAFQVKANETLKYVYEVYDSYNDVYHMKLVHSSETGKDILVPSVPECVWSGHQEYFSSFLEFGIVLVEHEGDDLLSLSIDDLRRAADPLDTNDANPNLIIARSNAGSYVFLPLRKYMGRKDFQNTVIVLDLLKQVMRLASALEVLTPVFKEKGLDKRVGVYSDLDPTA